MDSVNEIKYKVGDLTTRSVVLFPTRAQVCRELNGVELKHGINELVVSGITPTLDEDSLKVEGSGAAVITDIAVELLPNRDVYEEVYPESESDCSDDESDTFKKEDSPELTLARESFRALKVGLLAAKEKVASAEKRLIILDAYAESLSGKKEEVDMETFLTHYKTERAKAFEDSQNGSADERDIQQRVNEARKEIQKLQQKNDNAWKKRKAEWRKRQVIKEQKRQDRAAEKRRIKDERVKFWPKNCYSVRITLDVNTMTPLSSRRNSMSSDIEVGKALPSQDEAQDDSGEVTVHPCDLTITYATTSAYWNPNYDMQLSTTTASASLCFDAQLMNTTSETWKNCKITLSTSETALSGIDNNIPKLVPWNIRLGTKFDQQGSTNDSTITRSREENNNRQKFASQQKRHVVEQKSRSDMFGLPFISPYAPTYYYDSDGGNEREIDYAGPFGQAAPIARPGSASRAYTAQAQCAMAPTGPRRYRRHLDDGAPRLAESDDGADEAMGYVPGMDSLHMDVDEQQQAVDFEESLVEATGLTTTYDLPGLKTLVPKSNASKQRVARIKFSNVVLGHTVVAKYKPVAYLTAKLKNNSRMNLIEGPTGLTLDGSFMGRIQIPRCSSGDVFDLILGADPAIKVSYPKPEVRRATTGIINKENSSVYARAVVLHNSRAATGKAASLRVVDQVPVSQDEKLRVSLVTPNGLVVDGGSVATGAPARELDREREWGKASAKLVKGGELNWDVSLNPGKTVKLWLEYSVSMPVTEFAVQC